MSSLSSLALKANIERALIRPGGYKLKAATFAASTLALERESAAAKVLYERSENAREEITTLLTLLDPLIYDYLYAITEGKTKYEQGRISTTTGKDQQDAVLTTLAAVGICLQTGLMEHTTMSKMEEHLRGASEGIETLDKDVRTHYSAHNMTSLLDTLQSGPLAAELLGLADEEPKRFAPPVRPAAVKAREPATYEAIFGETDIYTRPQSTTLSRQTRRLSGMASGSAETSSSEVQHYQSNEHLDSQVASFFARGI